MADTDNEEIGLNIPVSAYADEDSAKKAVQDLTKNILGALKDGYIEIPTAISDEFDKSKASAKLIRAQKDFISQWEKMSKEGFSSSEEDLQNFVNKFTEFKRLMGKEGKAGSKQNLAIRDLGLNDLIQSYRKQLSSIQTEVTKQTRTTRRTTRNSTMTTKEKREQEEAIQAAINKKYGYDKLSKELKKGVGRARAATPGSPINLGLRKPSLEGPYVDEKTLRMSEISPYRNMDEVRRAKELQEIRARERASLTSRRATTEDIIKADEKVNQREASGMLQSGTEYQLIKRALLTELAKIQGGLIKGKPDATSQKLIDQVLANLAYDEEQGIDPLKSITSINNMLQKRYDTRGSIGVTDGSIKGEGPNQKETNETLKQIYKILGQFIEARQTIADNVRNIRDTLSDRTSSNNSLYARELNRITNSDQMQAIRDALSPTNGLLTRTLSQNTREGAREGAADNAANRASREAQATANDTLEVISQDASTGFNTDKLANNLIQSNSSSNTDMYTVLQEIRDLLQRIITGSTGGRGDTSFKKSTERQVAGLPSDTVIDPETGLFYKSKAIGEELKQPRRVLMREDEEDQKYQSARLKRFANSIEEAREEVEKGQHEFQQRQVLEPSEIITSQKGVFGQLRKIFKDILPQTEVDRIMSMNAQEQARMRAERVETYGLNRGRDLTDTGDIADVKRTKSLFGWIYRNDEKNKQLFQDVRLTPGFTGENRIDTTNIMKALNKVLSGPEMFKAQTGGTLRNIIGMMTGYIGMPSIEKSRAQAEGLNQVMANVRNEVLGLIQDIQAKEATLLGMQERGTARFDREGRITADSSLGAQNTFVKLEEQKQVLRSALAEVGMIDQVVDKTGGKVSKIIKNLGFVMPELMQNNTIIQNINAGLDKNGKALKFQTRLAEILNYSFQLMSRHIGQIIKNWLWMINPLNVIKKIFDDFASYDPKWQRTMNVIKNNFREIILPFMEKIAQTLVNIIGFLDIISMKIQEAFGYTPISLFDQENANEFKKTYEEIQSISASFDELHDIGSTSSENDPDNLLGEIYRPQLSQGWIDLANEIGDLFAGLITGDLGFGEVMERILKIAWKGLQQIWDWIKNTKIGKWITENWESILAAILAIFLGWKGLQIIGSTIAKTLLSGFTSVLSTLGTSFIKVFTEVFKNGGLISAFKNGSISLGNILSSTITSLLTLALSAVLWNVGKNLMQEDAAYNLGVALAGGDNFRETTGATLSYTTSGALAGATIGTAIGSLIPIPGANLVGLALGSYIGGKIGNDAGENQYEETQESLKEAVKLAQSTNGFYPLEIVSGITSSYTEQVQVLDETIQLLNKSLDTQTEKVIEQGVELGISKARMIELTNAVKDGTYNTSMLTGQEVLLTESLNGLVNTQENVTEKSKRLAEMKEKLNKLTMDEAILNDMAAGNYELAATRLEYAYLSGVYTMEEATGRMNQLLDTTAAETRASLLQDVGPEFKDNYVRYKLITEEGVNDLLDTLYYYNDEQKELLAGDLSDDVASALDSTIIAAQEELDKNPLKIDVMLGEFFSPLLPDHIIYKLFGVHPSGSGSLFQGSFATGTNYVQNDGLAYVHQGEAIIPKKYNQPYQPGTMSSEERAYMSQIMSTMRSLDSTLSQGIAVNGQFVQRGSDLVAVVNKTNSRTGADLLSNVAYAR